MKFNEVLSNYTGKDLDNNKCKHHWVKIKKNGKWIEYCDKCDSQKPIQECDGATGTGDVQGLQIGFQNKKNKIVRRSMKRKIKKYEIE